MLMAAWCVQAQAAEPFHTAIVKGRELYALKCMKCHKLRDPGEYDDATWSGWMEKMRKKAHLSDEQYNLIFQYTEAQRRST